jgi:hypothetical protein
MPNKLALPFGNLDSKELVLPFVRVASRDLAIVQAIHLLLVRLLQEFADPSPNLQA